MADPTPKPTEEPMPAVTAPDPAAPAPEAAEATPPLRVTVRAAKVMRGQLDKRGTPQAAIRFGIRGGGCTGYTYMFQYEDGPPRAAPDHARPDRGAHAGRAHPRTRRK